MYSNEQSRINATISYFFLGPIFLIAKTGTPLADPYVRSHAKKSSLIILVTLLVYIAYHFGVKPFTNISILGFYLQSVLTTSIVTVSIFFLLRGAYHAYHGKTGDETEDSNFLKKTFEASNSESTLVDSEELKIRILASLLPFFGIFIAKKYEHPLIQTGKKIGSLLTFFVILSIIFMGWESVITTIFTIVYVLIFTIEAVFLFTENTFQFSGWFDQIPRYQDFEAHFFSTLRYIGEFFRIAFGGESRSTYGEILETERSNTDSESRSSIPYFMPIWLIGIPFINLITLPSFFQSKFSEYRFVMLQGILLSILVGITLFFEGINSSYLLLFLFPMFHLMISAPENLMTRAPITGILARILGVGSFLGKKVQHLQEQKEAAHFSFEWNKNENI